MMRAYRVIAPGGATLRGPVKIGLTPDQHRRRTAVLGKPSKKHIYDVPGDAEIMLKHGEVFGMESPQRLNMQLFEDVEAADDAAAEAKLEAAELAKAEAEAKAQAEALQNQKQGSE